MTYRFQTAPWTLLAFVSIVGVAAAGQAPPTASGATTELNGRLDSADATTAPRTTWGHPDLRGVWNNSTTTPLEQLTEGEREQGGWPRNRCASRRPELERRGSSRRVGSNANHSSSTRLMVESRRCVPRRFGVSSSAKTADTVVGKATRGSIAIPGNAASPEPYRRR